MKIQMKMAVLYSKKFWIKMLPLFKMNIGYAQNEYRGISKMNREILQKQYIK